MQNHNIKIKKHARIHYKGDSILTPRLVINTDKWFEVDLKRAAKSPIIKSIPLTEIGELLKGESKLYIELGLEAKLKRDGQLRIKIPNLNFKMYFTIKETQIIMDTYQKFLKESEEGVYPRTTYISK